MASVQFQIVKARDLKPPKYRLRTNLGSPIPGQSMEELKSSIKDKGVLEPLLCRPSGDKIEVVAGQRRHLCAVELDVEVPIIVREIADKDAFVLALEENLARKSLDPLEEAEAFYAYTVKYGWGSQLQLAKEIHRSPSFIGERIQLREAKELHPFIESGRASVSDVLEVTGLPSEKAKAVLEMSTKAGLDTGEVRAVRNFVKAGMAPEQAVARVITLGTDIKMPPKTVESYDQVNVAREDIESALRLCLKSISDNIEKYIPDGAEKADWIALRYKVHEAVNDAIRLVKRYGKKRHD